MFTSGQLYLNGVDKTTSVSDPKQLTWGATRGQRGDCNVPLQLMAGDSYSPSVGDVIQIWDPPVGQPGARRVWIGTVENFEIDYQDKDGLRTATLRGVTLHQMFDTQPCPVADFQSANAGTIFSSIFSGAALPVAVVLGTVDAGVSVTRQYDPKTSIASAWSQLATDSNGYWDIDPRPATPTVNFIVGSVPSSGITLHDGNIVFGTNKYKQNRSNFRNKQIIEAPPGVTPSPCDSFAGDGSTKDFTLSQLPTQITSAWISTSSQATAHGTFTGQPSDGDTITISGIAYTFKATLNNSVGNQIKIGATFAITGQNATDALNINPAAAGTGYSLPTQTNAYVTAKWNSGTGVITLTAVQDGALGNGIALSESTANFTWASGTLTGGATGSLDGISFGSSGGGTFAGNFQMTWTPGSTTVSMADAPAVGQTLIVQYVSTMSNFSTVANDSATSLGIGSQYQVVAARNATEYGQVLQQANAILAGYSVIPGEYWFTSDDAGYFTGDGIDVALTQPPQLTVKVNGQPWIIQDVSASWIEGMEFNDEPYGHFRITVHLVNTVQFTPYQQTLQRLVSNSPITPGNANLPTTGLPGSDNGFKRVVYWERLVLSDTTVANDVMPHVTVAVPVLQQSPLSFIVGRGTVCLAVLSVAISADLTVRFNKITNGSPMSTVSWTVTIPNGTAVDQVIETDISSIEFFEGDVISGDVTASDGSKSTTKPWAIATFQIVWEA